MRHIFWAITGVTVFALLLGGSLPAYAAGGSSITGSVTDAVSKAPLANAAIALSGPQRLQGKSDSSGHFTFTGLVQGTYVLTAQRAGYQRSDSAPFQVGANEAVTLAVAMQPVSPTTLRTIASVRINGKQAVNTGSAPTAVVTNREFVAHGDVLVQQALEQTPGITIQHFDGGLGSVATLTIRGAGAMVGGSNTGYEVLVLQDGEPVRNGQYGDFDLSALTPAIYQRAEVLKGVGGTSLFGANSIGGTLNLVTRDPLAKQGGEFIGSLGSYATSNYDLVDTNTIGKFGYIFDLHRLGTDGPVPGGLIADYSSSCSSVGSCLLWHPSQSFALQSALGKIRYALSPVTSVTLTAQTEADVRDQLGLLTNPTTHHGQSTDPFGYPYFYGYPGDSVYNNQPKISLDVHSQIGGGDLILRSYGGELNRIVNGNAEPAAICCYLQQSVDRLYGDELYWTLPLKQNTITLAAGANGDYYYYGSTGSSDTPLTLSQINFTQGKQIERTYLVSDDYEISRRLDLNFAGYYSTYDTLNVKRFDPRLGLVFRPTASTAIRFSAASGFAPPRLSDIYNPPNYDINSSGSDPRCPSGAPYYGYCTISEGNPNIKAETAIGYDLGVDHVFGFENRGHVSLDLYRTNLHGHIFYGDFPAPPGTFFTNNGAPTTTPVLYVNEPINLSGSVYTGFELNGQVPIGANFAVSGYYTTQAAYPTGVDPNTEALIGDLVNNEQFDSVPVHMAGYGLHYYNAAGTEGFLQGDFFANNNAYNAPPFWVWNAGLTLPGIANNQLTFTWQNIFNKDATLFQLYNAGVPYPGLTGPYSTSIHPYMPHSIMVTFTHRWGSMVNP